MVALAVRQNGNAVEVERDLKKRKTCGKIEACLVLQKLLVCFST